MLTVKRRPGQEIIIGEGERSFSITVDDVRRAPAGYEVVVRIEAVRECRGGHEVTVSVGAPRDVLILRKELVGRLPKTAIT